MNIKVSREQLGILYMLVSQAEARKKYTNPVHNELTNLKIQFDSIAKSYT